MKTIKFRDSLIKFAYLILIAGLTIGLCSSAFGATTNKVISKPLILIGNSGVAGNVEIVESGVGALTGTITLQCPAGVAFKQQPTIAIDDGVITINTKDAVLSSSNTKAVWTIDKASTDTSTLTISNIELALKTTVAAGDISVELTSEYPGNPGLTSETLVVATAVANDAMASLDGDTVNVPIGDDKSTTINNIKIVEATAGSIEKDGMVIVKLPAGVTFDGNPSIAGSVGTAFVFDPAKDALGADTTDTATWKVTTVSDKADTITISNIKIKADATVSVGDISVSISAGKALSSSSLKIAKAAKQGVTAKADTAVNVLKDRSKMNLATITITENFPEDIEDKDELVITLPSGVTFYSNPKDGATYAKGDLKVNDGAVADPSGFETFTIPFNGKSGAIAVQELVLPIVANIGPNVADGDIEATISGTVSGSAITPINVTIGKVVTGAVTVAPNATIPVVGIGGSGDIGEFTIVESSGNALLANSNTITVTLPSGVSWNAAPTATIDPAGLTLSDADITNKSVAVFKVTKSSAKATTITIKGKIDLASTVGIADIEATIAGTSGASGTVTLATAADGVSVSTTKIPTLSAGVPTQKLANVVITEAINKGLADNGNFRLLTQSGTWAQVDPTITATGNYPTVGWTFSVETTYNTGDTMLVTLPADVATTASTITMEGLKLNVNTAATGSVQVNLLNGDMKGDKGAGIKSATLLMGSIDAPVALTVSSDTTTVPVGKTTAAITIAGGFPDYSATTSDAAVATASVSGTSVTITGVAAGTATITVADNADPTSTKTIAVTVVTPKTIGTATGAVTETDSAPADYIEMMLNITNTAGATPAQEWLVFGGTIGGQDIGVFFYTKDSAGVEDVKDFAAGLDPATATYAFDHTTDTVNVVTMTLAPLGFDAGDTFWYGYAYSATALTSFLDAAGALDPSIVIENYVTITLK